MAQRVNASQFEHNETHGDMRAAVLFNVSGIDVVMFFVFISTLGSKTAIHCLPVDDAPTTRQAFTVLTMSFHSGTALQLRGSFMGEHHQSQAKYTASNHKVGT
ncbi:hypothetical protein V8F33_000401 [Rhypophila sp. PSN 637]